MKSYDFEYDGITLSSLGYVICNFNSNGLNTVSNGSQITFNTVSTLNGDKFEITSSQYSECIVTTFQICKKLCSTNSSRNISRSELKALTKWLNRNEFCKFKLIDDEYSGIYFEGSFNINRIESNGNLVGLELILITNRDFGLYEPKVFNIDNSDPDETKTIIDVSEKVGFIYPKMEITIAENGNLSIHNSIEDRTMVINNCSAGEVITVEYPMISSSLTSHKIQNDFNWSFFRIANSYEENKNILTISLPCEIDIKYSPIAKIGF